VLRERERDRPRGARIPGRIRCDGGCRFIERFRRDDGSRERSAFPNASNAVLPFMQSSWVGFPAALGNSTSC
jgi:hypothetical protein